MAKYHNLVCIFIAVFLVCIILKLICNIKNYEICHSYQNSMIIKTYFSIINPANHLLQYYFKLIDLIFLVHMINPHMIKICFFLDLFILHSQGN